MAYRTQTPYGTFKTMKQLIKQIEKDPLEFILKYQRYVHKYAYDTWKNFHGNHTNNATRHFIYSTVRDELLGKDPLWVRLP